MKKGNIIFDLDNTLIYSLPVLIEYTNDRWGINSVKSDYYDENNLHKVVNKYKNGSPISSKQFYDDYVKNLALSLEWNNKIKPMPFMQEVIELLSEEYFLYIATKRVNTSKRIVDQILKNCYIAQYIESVYYAIGYVNFEGDRYFHLSKSYFIQNLRGKNIAFIDDSRYEIEKTKKIVPSYLFDPNNIHGQMDGVKKVNNLWEFANAIHS